MTRVVSFTEAVDWVKQSMDVLEVIGKTVTLTKRGKNYLGLCPFHPEKTPSFNVNREKNLFKCFGCGVSGDALAFIMKTENKTFTEVIRDTAAEHGLMILSDPNHQEDWQAKKSLEEQLYLLNADSAEWFQANLVTSEAAEGVRQYLEKRGLSASLLEQSQGLQSFQVGFALPGWENLTRYLCQQHPVIQENPSQLLTAGLANERSQEKGGRGGYYDRFRNRLMFPIHDIQGRVVGFGGRALSEADSPKYLNSPETPVYVKTRTLYGLFQAAEAIRKSATVVVMEGYFDVISAHLAGIQNAVGTCGTALTDQHLKLLTRLGVKTIYLAFDADIAGQNAALSAIAKIEALLDTPDLTVRVLQVPDGKDPDAFIQLYGAEAFRELFQDTQHAAQDWLTFKFESALKGLSLHLGEGRVEAARRLTPLLSAIGRPVLREEYMKRYAERLHISMDALFDEVKRYEKTKPGGAQAWLPGKTSESGSRQRSQKFSKKTFEKQAIFSDPLRLDKGVDKSNLLSRFSGPPQYFPEARNATDNNAFNFNSRSLGSVSRRARLERSLLSLLFTTCESMSFVLSILESNELQSEGIRRLVSEASALLSATDASWKLSTTASREESLSVFTRQLDAALSDSAFSNEPSAKQCLVDAIFEADTFLEQAKWQTLPVDLLVANVCKQAQKLSTMLQQEIRRETLRSLNEQVRNLESFLPETGESETVRPTSSLEEDLVTDAVLGAEDSQVMDKSLSLLQLHYELREKVKKQVVTNDPGFTSANDHANSLTLTYQSGNDTL